MIKTSITKQVYPNGQTYWQVHASGAGPRYRKKFHSREEAEKDRARLLAGHVDVDMREVTAALQMLRTSSRPGKGASLTQAVSYFLEKCEGTSTVTIAEYAKQFIARKTPVIRAKTLAEIRSYLRHFCLSFGETRPADVIVKQLEQYLSLHTSRSYRDKVLRPFFDWLSGRKIRHCTALESPPISRSPFDFIPRFKYTKQGKMDFLRVAEVQRLIQAAVPTLSLGYVLICLFTGVRPGELRETLKLGLP